MFSGSAEKKAWLEEAEWEVKVDCKSEKAEARKLHNLQRAAFYTRGFQIQTFCNERIQIKYRYF